MAPAQAMQKRAISGFVFPHAGQTAMRRSVRIAAIAAGHAPSRWPFLAGE
jgi:hypothetical protein